MTARTVWRRLRARIPGRGRVAALLAGLVVVALLALAVLQGMAWRAERADRAAERAATAQARRAAVALTSISASSFDRDAERLLALGTAAFRARFEATETSYRQVYATQQVASAGRVGQVALAGIGRRTATVLVTVSGRVATGEEEVTRNLRLRVDLRWKGDRWLVSSMAFG
ncbi:MAG: hypothetical protein QM572_02425 [Nocardioides sp.]|uniref:hypothetical protein n=1 Tax=Nocardioides sp. TaxID=35761 RepID=UPI0039E6B081